MARYLNALPRRQIFVNLTPGGVNFGFHCLDLGIEIDIMPVGMFPDFLQPPL
jgi:hypothetical protein